MAKTVLVTGGAGFIGAYMVRRLLAEGVDVVVYDQQPRGNVLDLLLPELSAGGTRIRIETGEITDAVRLLSLCRRHGVESAVHLASPLTMDVVNNPATGIRDICLGTNVVFSVAREARLRRVVWASSVAVFGPQRDYAPGALPDDAFHRPANIYGSAKSLCETLARQMAADKGGLDIVGLRLSVVYGAGRRRGYMSYPSHLMREAAAADHVHVRFGDQRLHWQYVEEVSDMAYAALTSPRRSDGRTFNAAGDCRTWREAGAALRLVRPALDITIGDEIDDALAGVVEDYDASGFRSHHDYTPSWSLEAGIGATLATYDAMRRREG